MHAGQSSFELHRYPNEIVTLFHCSAINCYRAVKVFIPPPSSHFDPIHCEKIRMINSVIMCYVVDFSGGRTIKVGTSLGRTLGPINEV